MAGNAAGVVIFVHFYSLVSVGARILVPSFCAGFPNTFITDAFHPIVTVIIIQTAILVAGAGVIACVIAGAARDVFAFVIVAGLVACAIVVAVAIARF